MSSYAKHMRIEDAAKRVGVISPKIVEALAQRHHMALKKDGTHQLISTRTLNQLRQLPEIGAIHQMAQLDDMGGEMTDEEIRELSETRPGRLPWHTPPQS